MDYIYFGTATLYQAKMFLTKAKQKYRCLDLFGHCAKCESVPDKGKACESENSSQILLFLQKSLSNNLFSVLLNDLVYVQVPKCLSM